jgi:hypothetical protein
VEAGEGHCGHLSSSAFGGVKLLPSPDNGRSFSFNPAADHRIIINDFFKFEPPNKSLPQEKSLVWILWYGGCKTPIGRVFSKPPGRRLFITGAVGAIASFIQ